MPMSLSQASRLCNASELKLFASSLPAEIGKLTDAQVATAIARARALKDKWSALAKEQIRTEQSAERRRAVDAAGRSESKARLFSEALDRFVKARESAAAGGVVTKSKTKGREGRAGVRDYLKSKRASINTEKRPTRGGAGVRPVASRPEASAPTTPAVSGAAGGLNPAKAKVKPKPKSSTQSTLLRALAADSTPATKLPPALAQPHLKLGSPVKAATARAKQRAIAKSGLTSRTRGQVSASGRRAQGKRDAR
jgi:hypothetical protein